MNQESFSTPSGSTSGATFGGNGSPTDTSHKAESGVAREYHAFLDDVSDLLSSATSMSGEDFARAKARLSARITAAKESVTRAGGALAQRARSGASATDQYVREQPWQAIGATAAVGLLVGFLLGRRGS
jgi:ElaB/YqjD/DUF883 family membrane-anchored ribosome-binding protein